MVKQGRIYILIGMWLCAACPCSAQTTAQHTETPCVGDEVTMVSTYNSAAESDIEYHWYQIRGAGDTVRLQSGGASLSITAEQEETYYCEVVTPAVTTEKNLMKNGDFEDLPLGVSIGSTSPNPQYFTSSYRFAGWHVTQPGDYENRYVMTQDASYYYNGFLPIKPHGGNWFALFDASTNGDAWRAETNNGNPDLKIVQGETYVFGYWVANPNNNDNPTARLQFYIEYKDANGQTKSENIGTVYDIKAIKNQGWQQQTVNWTAPVSSNEVAIAVKDMETNSEGNDFCLDDIIFQATSTTEQTSLHVDTFHIVPEICCPDVQYAFRDTTLCATQLPIVWDGLTFEEEGSIADTIPSAEHATCDSLVITYTLTLAAGVEMYSKWEDVIFVPNRDSAFVSYQWYRDGQPIDGATEQFYHDPKGLAGVYHCVMQTVSGGEEQTCPAAFDDLERSADYNPGDTPRKIVARRTYQVGPHLHIIVYTYDDDSTSAEKHWTL